MCCNPLRMGMISSRHDMLSRTSRTGGQSNRRWGSKAIRIGHSLEDSSLRTRKTALSAEILLGSPKTSRSISERNSRKIRLRCIFRRTLDKATGLPFDACILSVQAGKKEFNEINLALVEPRACIKKLKGVASSKLHQLAPVAPILQMDRRDERFVSSYEVAGTLDNSVNLAAMDWEDFEHLIREIFEKEFSVNGGEVKVTQASRDGGVDAVAFDPDPIRGGKIVIQAKRYTNPVGVSAVRDLYGTVMNEGATKGILVTTSHYGADAYEFAKGKPLTLLDGGNLLHLLDRHGHRAKIDIAEARKVARFRENHK